MSAPAYFIADDAHGDPWVWAKNGDRPIQVLNLLHVAPEHAPLLALIRAAVEGEVREEWGVRWPDEDGRVDGGWGEQAARSVVERRDHAALVHRTVITSAWQEVEG